MNDAETQGFFTGRFINPASGLFEPAGCVFKPWESKVAMCADVTLSAVYEAKFAKDCKSFDLVSLDTVIANQFGGRPKVASAHCKYVSEI